MDDNKKGERKIDGQRSKPWRLWRVSGIDGHLIVCISAASIGTTRPITTGCPSLRTVIGRAVSGWEATPRRACPFPDLERAEDTERNTGASMITVGQSWNSIQAATGCSRATIAKRAKAA
jgi:hypothetical protein